MEMGNRNMQQEQAVFVELRNFAGVLGDGLTKTRT